MYAWMYVVSMITSYVHIAWLRSTKFGLQPHRIESKIVDVPEPRDFSHAPWSIMLLMQIFVDNSFNIYRSPTLKIAKWLYK